MRDTTRQRRQLCAAALTLGAGALAANAMAQPQSPDKPVPAERFGQMHRAGVAGGLRALDGKDPRSADGLKRLVNKLEAEKLLDADTAQSIRHLVDLLVDAKNKSEVALDKVLAYVKDTIAKWKDKGSDLFRALLGIVEDSIGWCKEAAQQLQTSQKVQIVLDDLMGALVGAGSGAAAGALFGPTAMALLAAIGAVGGAASASLKSTHDALSQNRKG